MFKEIKIQWEIIHIFSWEFDRAMNMSILFYLITVCVTFFLISFVPYYYSVRNIKKLQKNIRTVVKYICCKPGPKPLFLRGKPLNLFSSYRSFNWLIPRPNDSYQYPPRSRSTTWDDVKTLWWGSSIGKLYGSQCHSLDY